MGGWAVVEEWRDKGRLYSKEVNNRGGGGWRWLKLKRRGGGAGGWGDGKGFDSF